MLSCVDIIVGGREQAGYARLDIVANIPSLCEGSAVGHGDGQAQRLCQCLAHQCLAYTSRTKYKHIGLFYLQLALASIEQGIGVGGSGRGWFVGRCFAVG